MPDAKMRMGQPLTNPSPEPEGCPSVSSSTRLSDHSLLLSEMSKQRGRSLVHEAGKMLVPLLGLLAVLAMAVAGVAIFLQMQERDKRVAKEQELHVALSENDDLKTRLEDTQQAKTKAEDELTHLRKEYSTTQEKLVQAATAQETLTRSVEERQKEVERLTKDLEQTRTQHKEAATQLSELQSEHETMKRQLSELERAKGELETKVMEISQQPTVELDKVLVTSDNKSSTSAKPQTSAAAATSATGDARTTPNGQVMVVNREYDFIVMNLGKSHGLSIGQEFQIVRGTEVLGKVKVEKVYDELSAAAILPESRKDSIREGDTVRAL